MANRIAAPIATIRNLPAKFDSRAGQDSASVTSHTAMQRIITDAAAGVRAQVPASGMCPAMTLYDHVFADKFDGAPAVSCPGTVNLP